MRVTVHIVDVPNLTQGHWQSHLFTIFGLLQHEHKISVQNFKVQRDTECDATVRSKVRAPRQFLVT
jgi:pre-rRNA-processing protein TSR1